MERGQGNAERADAGLYGVVASQTLRFCLKPILPFLFITIKWSCSQPRNRFNALRQGLEAPIGRQSAGKRPQSAARADRKLTVIKLFKEHSQAKVSDFVKHNRA